MAQETEAKPAESAPAGEILSADQFDEDTLTLALDVAQGEPPTSFRLFGQGTTRTTRGDLLFDEQAATDVMAAMAEHGKADLPIDYGHGMLSMIKTPDSGVAAGWFKPAVVDSELWATEVQWTPRADKALRAREYRYHSPAVKYHPDTRRVTKLVNVALTNLHATKGLKPLVASETDNPSAPVQGAEEANTMSEKLFARLGAKDEAEAVIMLAEHETWTKDVLAALDCTKLAEAVPAIKARFDKATELAGVIVTLTSERDALTAADADRKRETMIAELSEAGKLPPALHDWAKTITIEQLTEFGNKAEPSAKTEPASPKPAASSDPTVTPEMQKVAKQLGVSVEDIKANLAAKSAE